MEETCRPPLWARADYLESVGRTPSVTLKSYHILVPSLIVTHTTFLGLCPSAKPKQSKGDFYVCMDYKPIRRSAKNAPARRAVVVRYIDDSGSDRFRSA